MQQDKEALERAKEQQAQMIDSQKDELAQRQLDIDKQKVSYAHQRFTPNHEARSDGRVCDDRVHTVTYDIRRCQLVT